MPRFSGAERRLEILLRKARVGVLGIVALALAACGISVANSASAGPERSSAMKWVDEQVSFPAGGVTIYGTFRHPVDSANDIPGVLLIAGSGPTDRNGNSALSPGSIGTLKTIADWLSEDGVASLRYDKLGSGQTGFGPYSSDKSGIGIRPFEAESLAALRYLTEQPKIDKGRVGVIGHSEGALFALLLASGVDGSTPAIRALGLVEPLSIRYLDLVKVQGGQQIESEAKANYFTAQQAASAMEALSSAVTQLRTTGKLPSNLPYGLEGLFSQPSTRFLYQADKYDPASLAKKLPSGMPVLVSCSTSDKQVSCGEVDHLVTGLVSGGAKLDFVHLVGVDHVLKIDPSGSAADFSEPLPFSSQFKSALARFVRSSLS